MSGGFLGFGRLFLPGFPTMENSIRYSIKHRNIPVSCFLSVLCSSLDIIISHSHFFGVIGRGRLRRRRPAIHLRYSRTSLQLAQLRLGILTSFFRCRTSFGAPRSHKLRKNISYFLIGGSHRGPGAGQDTLQQKAVMTTRNLITSAWVAQISVEEALEMRFFGKELQRT